MRAPQSHVRPILERAHMDRGGTHEDKGHGRRGAPQSIKTEEQAARSEKSQRNNHEPSDVATISDEEGQWTV